MFVLDEHIRSKKRLRDSVELVPGHLHDDVAEGPTKRTRTAQSSIHSAHRPPAFWDGLSKVHLTRGALREFDRRITQTGKPPSAKPADRGPSAEPRVRWVKRFSRHGGPDLTHVRGFALSHDPGDTMSQSSSNRKRSSASRLSGSGCSDSTRKSRSSYDSNFKQNMIDDAIYPEGHEPYDLEEVRNLNAIHEALAVPRASLSPSRFSGSAFKEFKKTNDRAPGETRAMSDVFESIEGKGRHKYHSDGPDHPFNHLEPVSKYLPIAKPDVYDGARPAQIDRRVRQDLGRYIVPCNESSRPAAPNFFVEGKSAKGRADVARLQACHDGAIGARAMHSLQNYGAPESQFDGDIKSFSTTYHPGTGTLQIYGHHMTPSQDPNGRAEYHMTQIDSYAMTGNARSFREGATAFRNLRDMAESHRDELILQANLVAQHAPLQSPFTTLIE